MPQCNKCKYEGPYDIHTPNKVTFFAKDGMVETPLKYMKCQAPGGGPTEEPISIMEANKDEPCEFFQAREKPRQKSGLSLLISKFFGGKKYKNVKFKEKMTQGPHTYEIYSGSTKKEALDFWTPSS